MLMHDMHVGGTLMQQKFLVPPKPPDPNTLKHISLNIQKEDSSSRIANDAMNVNGIHSHESAYVVYPLFLPFQFIMNIITWNYRGVGRRSLLGLIRDLQLKYEAQFIILMETHVSGNRCNGIIKKTGFDSYCISKAQGHSGGIWCLWDYSMWNVQVISSC